MEMRFVRWSRACRATVLIMYLQIKQYAILACLKQTPGRRSKKQAPLCQRRAGPRQLPSASLHFLRRVDESLSKMHGLVGFDLA